MYELAARAKKAVPGEHVGPFLGAATAAHGAWLRRETPMLLQRCVQSALTLVLSIALAGLSAHAHPALQKGAPKPGPVAPAKPATPPATAPAQPPGQRATDKSAERGAASPKLRGEPSPDGENSRGESDERFDPRSLAKSSRKPTAASASALRLADHPKREELAQWIENAIRGREIDVALLGGHKYMINDCLGVKASSGKFKLKLDNPSVRFENTGLVIKFSIPHASISVVKIRIRPNPNVLEVCSFSDKFEVGGAMEDVTLTLRMDPFYDLERCRLASWGDSNPEVRIGNLNLKPLQNDLDRMAKNMVEDALTTYLQISVDGYASFMGEMISASIDGFLEADCPTKSGDTARAVRGVLGAGGVRANGDGGAAGASGTAESNDSATIADLRARVDTLEARIAELERRDSVPNDLHSALELALAHIAALDPAARATPQVEALLASVLALAVDRSGIADRHAAFAEVLRIGANLPIKTAEPVGAASVPYTVVANPQLKGRMGRVVVRFPDSKLASETFVAVERDGQRVQGHYGEAAWELLPGRYVIKISDSAIEDCEVRSGCDTNVRVGMFQFDGSNQTFSSIFTSKDPAAPKLWGKYGSYVVGLPVGRFELELSGQRETIEIREGEITRF